MTYQTIQQQLDKGWRVFDPNRLIFLRQVLQWVGQPDQGLTIIQIAGTNGKGSTGAMLREVLRAHGETVGHFASPAVFNDREQIWLNGQFVTEAAWVTAYQQLLQALVAHDRTIDDLSYFEVWTIVALLVFQAEHVTYAILEAGLGGRDDATHMVGQAAVVAYTEIGLDHQNILGQTLAEIAQNKADLITPGALVVSDLAQPAEVLTILKTTTQAKQATWAAQPMTVSVRQDTPAGLAVSVAGEHYQLGLVGAFQRRNLSVVWQILAALETRDQLSIDVATRRRGLVQAQMLGRMQVDQTRHILWDGAHNEDAAQGLVATLTNWALPERPILVLGVLADKNYHQMLTILLPLVSAVITVTPNNPRALSATALAEAVQAIDADLPVTVMDQNPLAYAMAQRTSASQYIVVAGSFYTLNVVGGFS
ncbi:Mur ligase family protein [Leuconostoc lactis]|uniref:bifunctional folylpolyglutamate synthase/dihydrofolate synthase n=1 Tax=Leuconostoc lactis TaxID=1246 RepID=UPI00272CE1FC|nr:cyanophycin synthetase [Leuconostoc lactis]WKY78525.1 Mur ligase family protein [Leuconostoc lactis]